MHERWGEVRFERVVGDPTRFDTIRTVPEHSAYYPKPHTSKLVDMELRKLVSVCNVFLRNTGCTRAKLIVLGGAGGPGELREGGKGGARGTACFRWIQSGW